MRLLPVAEGGVEIALGLNSGGDDGHEMTERTYLRLKKSKIKIRV